MKKINLILSTLLLATMLAALCGCVPTPTTTPTEQPAEPTIVPATKVPTVEPTAAKPFLGKQITVLYMSGVYADAARLIKSDFETRTGATVNVVDFPYSTLYEKTFNDLSSNTCSFDVDSVAYQWDGQFAPYMADLASYLANDPTVKMDDFIPAVAKNTGIWGTKRFGLPNAATGTGLFLRKDIFAEKNLQPPTTWDEYLALAKQLNNPGVIYGTGVPGKKEQLGTEWTTWYWAMGGHLLTPDYKPMVNSEIGIKSLTMFLESFNYAPPGAKTWDIPDEFGAVLSGQVAMAQVWPGPLVPLLDNPSSSAIVGKWMFASEPGARPHLSAWSVGIADCSKNKDLAWEWIKTYTNAANQKTFYEQQGIGPTLASVYQDPTLLANHPDLAFMLENLKRASPRFRFAQSQEAFDYLDEKISEALAGTITPAQALQQVSDKWTELLSANTPDVPYTDDYLTP
jgi:ABC-type glycerol-3-phosphate transport system substrate-binding protein